MTEAQAWVAISWLAVIGLSVADSAWMALLLFVVILATTIATLLVLQRLWP